MDLVSCLDNAPCVLMEGALGERLKREHGLEFDEHVAMAGLVYDAQGRAALTQLWSEYAGIARDNALPLLVTTPTRRANRERVAASCFDESIILDNVVLLRSIQGLSPAGVYVGGLMGCRGDAYRATDVLPATQARAFHSWQAGLFAEAGVDFLYAGIMPALSETIGMAQAMEDCGLPYIISFMIRRDGKLPDGTTIHEAIRTVDGRVGHAARLLHDQLRPPGRSVRSALPAVQCDGTRAISLLGHPGQRIAAAP